MPIKSNSISKISIPVNVSIFSQSDCSKLIIFKCQIIASINVFTYLMNNVNAYYFSMSIQNFVLFQTTSTKFCSCFSTIIIQEWSTTTIRRDNRINYFFRQSFRFPVINVTTITNTSNNFKIFLHWLKY